MNVQPNGEYPAGQDITNQLINPTNSVQAVTYLFKARIRDDRPGHIGNFCDQGGDTTIVIYVNPTARLSVSVPDTVVCDSSTVTITVNDLNGNVAGGTTKVYQLTTTNPGGVLNVQPNGEYPAGQDITNQLINPTNSVQAVTYLFKARIRDDRPGHIGNFCDQGGDTTIVIYVNPTPRLSVSVPDTVVCDSSTVTITVNDLNGNVAGGTTKVYQLTTTNPGGVLNVQPNGEYPAGQDITNQLINPTNSVQAVTYLFKARIRDDRPGHIGNFCDQGGDTTIVIYVQPTARLSVSVPDTVVCDSSTVTITVNDLNGNVAGGTTKVYQLTTTNPGGVLNVQPNGEYPAGQDITNQLINPTNSVQAVTYLFKARIRDDRPGHVGNFCDQGGDTTIVIYVNPTARLSVSVPDTVVCDSSTVTITVNDLNGNVAGGTTKVYQLTTTNPGGVLNVQPNGEYPAGQDITNQLINPTNSVQAVTYLFKARIRDDRPGHIGNFCDQGGDTTIVIYVNPTPRLSVSVPDTVVCDSSTVTITVNDLNGNVAGGTTKVYQLTTTNPGGVLNVQPNGEYPAGQDITNQLINPTNSVQAVTYLFKARIRDDRPGHIGNFCDQGGDTTIVIYVQPTARLSVSVPDTVVCDSSTVTITVNDLNGNVAGGTTKVYQLTTTNPGGVLNVQPNGEYPAGQDITNQLINPTNSVQAVTYLFKARIRDDRPGHIGNFCDQGGDTTIVIYVQPTARLSVSVPDTVVCDSSTVTITVNDLNGNVAGGTTKVYQLTTTNPGGVLNVQPNGEYPAGQDITNQLINPTNSVQAVTYLFKARIRDDRPGHAGNFCDQGGDTTIVIYVEPTPRVTGTITPNDTICNNTLITYTLASPTMPYFGQASLRFNVIVINPYPAEISGYSNQADLPLTSIIAETLNNSGDTARMIMYIITPATTNILGMQNCPGINDTIRLWINPTPRVIPLNAKPAICSTESTEIILTSPTVMTKGAITFDYTVTVSGGPGDLVGSTAAVTGMMPGQKIVLPYTNNSDTIQWINYYITPRNIPSGCADGNINIPKVNVHAVPVQDLIISTPLLCDGGSDAVLTAYLSRGAKPDSVLWEGAWSTYDGYWTSADSTNSDYLKTGVYWITAIDSLGCRARSNNIYVSGAILDSYFYVVEKDPLYIYGTTCPESADGVIGLKENISSTGIPPFEYWIVRNSQDTVRHDTLFVLGEPYHYTSNLAPGHYQLFIYDANGCVNTSYPEVNIVPPDTITVEFEKLEYPGGYNVSCRGYSNGSVWIDTISGGSGGYTYKWSTINGTITGPDTLNRLDNITAGTYYLTTTDLMDCIKVDSVTLLDPEGMDLTSSEVSWSPDGDYNISCSGGSDGFIKLSITGGSGIYTFLWTGPNSYTASTKDISGLKAGTYTCTVKDLNLCILVPMPTFTLTEPALLNISAALSTSTYGSFNINCNAGTGSIDVTVTGGSTGNYFYAWTTTNGSGLVNGQEDQNSLTAGTYHLVVADSNMCFTEQDITLTQPPAMEVSFVPTHITCQSSGFDNGSIDLTPSEGVGPYTFIWSNGAITEDISGLTEGYYSVTVTDANGCTITDSTRMNMPAELLFTKTVSDPNGNGFNISCNGAADGFINISTIDGLAPFIFSWTSPTNPSFSATLKIFRVLVPERMLY